MDAFLKIGGISALLVSLFIPSSGCLFSSKDPPPPPTPAEEPACPALVGSPYVASVLGSGSSNHGDSTLSKTQQQLTGLVTGVSQSFNLSGSHVVTFQFTVAEDLGDQGSVTLVADVPTIPAELAKSGGSVQPILLSLSDGVHELVNVSGCDGSGFYTCDAQGYCSLRSQCGPGALTAYLGATAAIRQEQWEQSQSVWNGSSVSTLRIPTCNWNDGSCAFQSTFFQNGKLKTGTYVAKYAMISEFLDLGDNHSADLRFSVIRKKKNSNNSAMDINLVIVGSRNVQDSRTTRGRQNLDSILSQLHQIYFTQNEGSTGIKLGQIKVYEWGCDNGGDHWANMPMDSLGDFLKEGSSLVPAEGESRALNVFLVSTVPYSGGGTILGVAGGIGGPPINGTRESGLVFSSFNGIAKYSAADQAQMGSTIAHEMGHFLGLNHLSESRGTIHDPLNDTPACTTQGSNGYITKSSCKSEASCSSVCSGTYCANETACEFNHVMWWTSKGFDSSGVGDGNIFSVQSGGVIKYSAYAQ